MIKSTLWSSIASREANLGDTPLTLYESLCYGEHQPWETSFYEFVKSDERMIGHLERRHTLEGHHGCVNTIQFSPDGSIVVTGSDDTCIHLYDVVSGDLIERISTLHSANIFCARFLTNSPNNQSTFEQYSQLGVIAVCSADGIVSKIDLNKISTPSSSSSSTTNQEELLYLGDQIGEHVGRAHRLETLGAHLVFIIFA